MRRRLKANRMNVVLHCYNMASALSRPQMNRRDFPMLVDLIHILPSCLGLRQLVRSVSNPAEDYVTAHPPITFCTTPRQLAESITLHETKKANERPAR